MRINTGVGANPNTGASIPANGGGDRRPERPDTGAVLLGRTIPAPFD